MSEKKVRSVNLSHSEKLLLVDLVTYYKDIIENKRTAKLEENRSTVNRLNLTKTVIYA